MKIGPRLEAKLPFFAQYLDTHRVTDQYTLGNSTKVRPRHVDEMVDQLNSRGWQIEKIVSGRVLLITVHRVGDQP